MCIRDSNNTKKAEDLSEAYSINYKGAVNGVTYEYLLVNTSGKVIDGKSKSKDGNDYYYVCLLYTSRCV